MEWSLGVEPSHRVEFWSGFWSGVKSDLELLLPFLDRIWFGLTSSFSMLTQFYDALCT